MDDLISRLSDLRTQYNLFDENGRDAYRTLSEAIEVVNLQQTCNKLETDCISRQAAIDALVKAIRNDPCYDSNERINGLGVCDVRVIINDLPSAQPRKGKWIRDRDSIYHCSCCGTDYLIYDAEVQDTHYCPNCGADMRGEKDDD